jgi:hypothetical protein
MSLIARWTVEDREHLAVVTLGPFELPDRGELVRRITENYVPARHYRGAVSLTDEQWECVLWWLHKPVPPGPAKALDEAIIRAINAQRGQ